LVSGTYYGCANRKNKGTCDNSERITIDRLEEIVLSAVQSQMMTPELPKVFIAEYSVPLSGLREDAIRSKTEQFQKKKKFEDSINNIVEVVASGHASAALLIKLTVFEEELAVLDKALQPEESAPIYFHPNLAKHYEKQIDFVEQSQEVCRIVKIPIYHRPERPSGAEILGGLVIGGALGKVISGDDKGALAGAVVGGLVTSSRQEPRIVGYSRKRVCEDKIFHR
jgi:hypothetical protein